MPPSLRRRRSHVQIVSGPPSLAPPEPAAWHCPQVAQGRDPTGTRPPSRPRSLRGWPPVLHGRLAGRIRPVFHGLMLPHSARRNRFALPLWWCGVLRLGDRPCVGAGMTGSAPFHTAAAPHTSGVRCEPERANIVTDYAHPRLPNGQTYRVFLIQNGPVFRAQVTGRAPLIGLFRFARPPLTPETEGELAVHHRTLITRPIRWAGADKTYFRVELLFSVSLSRTGRWSGGATSLSALNKLS